MEIDVQETPLEPWFNDLNGDHPFKLEVKVTATIACFPWDIHSLDKIWSGEFMHKDVQWRKMIEKWSGVIAVGGGTKLRLILTRPHQQYLPLFSIEVPDTKASVRCVAWCMAMNADEFSPLVAFSGNSILYVLNVEKGTFHGVMRGHGGKINALAVHPVDPSYLLSASHDHTCRIYDLTEKVECDIVNPSWPGKTKMSLAGPAFGLRANDGEGIGYGRCVAVLAGGHPAFHPTFPLVATCGMDHAVKLWQMPNLKGEMIDREDKPLFSSTRVHSAQALSIDWLGQDILLSTSGPIILRNEETHELYRRPGTLVLWRWLGLNRFFPPGRDQWPRHLRGCASSPAYTPPIEPTHAHVFQSPAHTPLIAMPSRGCIRASSVRHFTPRKPPPFPHAASEDDQLSEATHRLHLDQDAADGQIARLALPCWAVETSEGALNAVESAGDEASFLGLPKLEACAIGENGRLLVGVGAKEGIWIWRIPPEKQLRRAQASETETS
ncbi:WD40 repeat-like protein [Phellopilus nigrolimitatus]|nr:WD40 repeat-like protein [Phellopilus nigrolimitatus]